MEGYSAYYGENKIVISVIKAPGNEVADEYFEFAILPNFYKMKINSRVKINGKWSANGTDHDGRIWVGWVNNNWVFLLNGSDKKYYKMAVDVFKYVSE